MRVLDAGSARQHKVMDIVQHTPHSSGQLVKRNSGLRKEVRKNKHAYVSRAQLSDIGDRKDKLGLPFPQCTAPPQ